jgi:Curli production assembly/transport component CsgG/PEGA domain
MTAWSRSVFPTIVAATLGVILSLGASLPGRAAPAGGKKPVVLVPPFENQSRNHETIIQETAAGTAPGQPRQKFSVDRYSEAPRSLLEDMLGQIPGLQIAERQRVDALLLESKFGAKSGLVDTENALRLGKMLGANLIVMGTVVDIRQEVKDFVGYGIRSRITEVVCKIRIRLLDSSGTVLYSKVVSGSKQYDQSNFGGSGSSDRNFAAIEETLKEVEKDGAFRKALLGDAAPAHAAEGLIEVEFAPKPDNCDVEIDGKYVGGSPLKRRLPAGKEIKVRISKGGYQAWDGVIVPEAGLRITREMDRR